MFEVIGLVSGMGWHVQDLQRAAGRLGMPFRAVLFPTLVGNLGGARGGVTAGACSLDAAGAVLVRMMPPGSLEQVVYRMDALLRLERNGVLVVNPPRAIETAVDKYLALGCLESAGLPVPRTWVCEHAEDALAGFEALGRDVVVKPLFGSEGRGLVRVSDAETAWRVFHALERTGFVIYLQRFLENDGYDMRLFVLNGRVVAAVRRAARAGEWRANLSQGGTATSFQPDAELERLATQAAGAVGARLAGVDILPTRAGEQVVLEVNAVPGWRGLAAATGVDIAAEILNDLRQAMRGGRGGPP